MLQSHYDESLIDINEPNEQILWDNMAYYNANIESDDQIIENFENVIDQLEQR